MLWGYGAWWLVLAMLKTLRYLRDGLPFNLGWWGFTFPLAVYTLATLALHRATGNALFSVTAGLMTICLTMFWFVVGTRTLNGARTMVLFTAPCLKNSSWPVEFETDVV